METRVRDRVLLLVALGSMELVTGCNRPAWEKKSAQRREAVRHHVCWYKVHDAAGKERLGVTFGRIRKARCYHEEHLETTADLARREMEYDERRWCEDRPKRRAFARRQWCGNPDTIPDTWAKMVY